MNLNRVDLNLLVALDALLAERNVTKAGTRLSLSQPAMSAALARLRKMFDDPLLIRSGRSLRPTPLAESLVQPVREILSLIEDTLAERPEFDPATDTRTFSIRASDYAAIILIRPLYELVAKEAPHVRLRVSPLTGRDVDELARDEVDLLVLPREFASAAPDFPHQTLFVDRFIGAACLHHPDVRRNLTLTQFATLPYLSAPAGPMAAFVEAQLDELGIHRSPTVTTDSFATAPFLLRGTRLVTLLLERFARQVADAAELRLFNPPVELRPISEAMHWHPRRQRDPAHQWLRSRVNAIAEGI
jgi:DNA-binding transcriptional LysR family regulator